jgi:hypothetical protein
MSSASTVARRAGVESVRRVTDGKTSGSLPGAEAAQTARDCRFAERGYDRTMLRQAEPKRAPANEHRQLNAELRWLLLIFAVLALIAGVQLFLLSEDTDRFFSWTIEPPQTAAFLGASYWAACVLIAWSAWRRTWVEARPAFPPVFVIAVLLLAATLIHLDRFDMDSLFGWFWLSAYVVVPVVVAIALWRQLRAPGTDAPRSRPFPAGLRAALFPQALVMLSLGAALFVAPTSADALLPWSLTPLTARAVGAFVFGFGVATAHASLENDLVRFRGAALAYLTLGLLQLVAVARYWDQLDGEGPGDSLYVAFLVAVVATGLYGLACALREGSAPTDSRARSRS